MPPGLAAPAASESPSAALPAVFPHKQQHLGAARGVVDGALAGRGEQQVGLAGLVPEHALAVVGGFNPG
jgi:hypothetical protein